MKALRTALFTACLAAMAAAAGAGRPEEKSVALDIKAQPVGDALNAFAAQTGLQVVLFAEISEGIATPPINGSYAPEAALKLLLANTGLRYEYINDRTVAIRGRSQAPSGSATSVSQDADAAASLRVAQADVPASAQDGDDGANIPADTVDGQSTKTIPEILVKGSRSLNMDIKRSRDDSQPYTIFSRAEIENSGASTLQDFLRSRLTTLSVGPSSSQLRGGSASSSINLRGLGPSQTLILVDGRRTASVPIGGEQFQADINGIPVSAIERIDVLSTTSAGIYGGGATGGVINIVMKRDYTGIEATVTREDTIDGGGAGNRVDLNGGLSFGSDRSSIAFSASYSNRNELFAGDRDLVQRGRAHILDVNPSSIYNNPTPPLGTTTNIRSQNGQPLILKAAYGSVPLGSAFTFVPLGYGGPSSDAAVGLINNAGQYNLEFANTAQTDGLRQSLYNAPTVKSFNATFRHDFTRRFQAFVDFSSASNAGEFAVNSLSGRFSLPTSAASNPFNQNITVTTPAFGADQLSEVEVDDSRAVGGVIFALSGQWQVSADLTWNRKRYFATAPNSSIGSSVGAAIDGGTVNVFRDTNTSPIDLSPYLLAPSTSGPMHATMTSAVGRVAGPLPLRLPGGQIELTASAEHLREVLDDARSIFPFDGFDFENTTFQRSRTTDSLYSELRLPIVGAHNRIPWVRDLDLRLSARWDRYDTRSGNSSDTFDPASPISTHNSFRSVDPLLSLRWSLSDDVAIRASAGTGFQPPSLPNLSPAIPGVLDPAQIAADDLRDPKRGNELLGETGNTVATVGGGNPNLKPEESRSASIGVIVTPRAVAGLRVSVDWTQIRKTDNISSLSVTNDNIALEDSVPGLIQRAAPLNDGQPVGPITGFNSGWLNFARQTVEAYDVTAEFRTDTGRFGAFTASAAATRNTRNDVTIIPLTPAFDVLGILAFSKLQGNAILAWDKMGWNASWTTHYTAPYWLSVSHAVAVNQGAAKISSEVYHDVLFGYSTGSMPGRGALLSHGEIRLGVKNVFNRRPNIDVTNLAAPYSVSGDPRLGMYWLSLRKSFSQ